MKLYHGSNMTINQIDLSKSKVNRKSDQTFEEIMSNESFMIEEITKEIIYLLIEERHMSMREALHTLYTSDTYARLIDTRNGLYTQSTAYVYEYLEKELSTGKMS